MELAFSMCLLSQTKCLGRFAYQSLRNTDFHPQFGILFGEFRYPTFLSLHSCLQFMDLSLQHIT